MYDPQQYKNLQNKSHVRGLLSKQFYFEQQNQLQKKRKQMKQILDQQVQQKRRQKQKQSNDYQNQLRKQQQQIKKYYANIQNRQHKKRQQKQKYHLQNFSNSNPISLQTLPKIRSRIKTNNDYQQNLNGISNIPVMVMQPNNNYNNYHNNNNYNNYNNHKHNNINHINNQTNNRHATLINNRNSSAGNIPLLDLSQETYKNKPFLSQNSINNFNYFSSNRNQNLNNHIYHNNLSQLQQSKRNPDKNNERSDRLNSNYGSNVNSSNYQPSLSSPPKSFAVNQSKKFNQHQVNVLAPQQQIGSRKNTQNREINDMAATRHVHQQKIQQLESAFGFPQLQQQNKALKGQLKKSQQAISLLIGAVSSNNRLSKFKIQAQKILHGNSSSIQKNIHLKNINDKKQSRVFDQKQINSDFMLPKIDLRHQSILHDYMLGAAKKAYNKNSNNNFRK